MEPEVDAQSEQESLKKSDEAESHGNDRHGAVDVEVAEDNFVAHVEISQVSVNEVAGTGEVKREVIEELDVANHQNGNLGEEEENSNPAEANREESLDHGEQQQQQPGEGLVQQLRDEAGGSPVQHSLAGGGDQVEDREVAEEDAETAGYEEMTGPSPAPQPSSSVVINGGDVERGLLVENMDFQAAEEEEVEVGEQERNICSNETPGKLFKQMKDLKPTDYEKIDEEVVEHNMMTETNEEVDNTGSEGEIDNARDGLEKSINSRKCNGGGHSATVEPCRRGATKVQKAKLTQLAQDWSDEEFEMSGVGRLGGMGDTIKEVVVSRRRPEVGEAAPDPTVDVAVSRGGSGKAGGSGKKGVSGSKNNANKEVDGKASLKRKGVEEMVVKKKKKVQSWRSKPSEESNVVAEADDRSETGTEKFVKRRQEIGNKKKRLLGSKTAMLQDSPLMVDAPTFDTTLPAFEEAHNTSKHQKSFQEPPRRMDVSDQDISHESVQQDPALPGIQEKDQSSDQQRVRTTAKLAEPSIKPRGKAVNAATKKPQDGLSKRKMHPVNVSVANLGTKRKTAVPNSGRRRKAPRRTITHLDFPNYDHLKVIPRKPEDVTRSFHDASNLSEYSKPRQFFKRSPIPEEYKRGCANQTSRLNLTGSFMKRSGVVGKRRSSVNMSAIESIILPQAPRSIHDQQTSNWNCEEEELGGKSTCVRRPAPGSKSSCPRMVDVGTSTDEGVVTMSAEDFNQVLVWLFVLFGQLGASVPHFTLPPK